jgi:DNA-damage-inducible protein J
MATTSINIRMDSDLKNQFEAFCSDMGMSMSTAFNIFAKKSVREYRIPFEIGAEKPNADTLAAIEEGRKMTSDPDAPRYSSISELREALEI